MHRFQDGNNVVQAFNLPDDLVIVGRQVHIGFCFFEDVLADHDGVAALGEVTLVRRAVQDAADPGGVDVVPAHRFNDVLAVGLNQAAAMPVVVFQVQGVPVLNRLGQPKAGREIKVDLFAAGKGQG